MDEFKGVDPGTELYHYGRKGMKWYQRIFSKDKGSTKKQSGEKEETLEQKKERILKSRSAKTIYENAHLFNDKELQTAYNRLQLERNIANLSPGEVGKAEAFVNKSIKVSNKASEVLESGSRLYNNVAKIFNAFSDSELPTIKGTVDKETRRKQKAEADKAEAEAEAAKYRAKQAKKETTGDSKDASNKKTKTTDKKVNADKDFDDTTYTGKVYGKGNSKGSQTNNDQQKKSGKIYEAEWTEAVDYESVKRATNYVSNLLSNSGQSNGSSGLLTDKNLSSGQTYVAGLLEAPKDR